MMRESGVKVALLFVLLIYSGAVGGELKERFEKTYALASGGRFSLKNTNGSVHVVSWNRQEVRIEAEKRARAGSEKDAERLLAATEIIVRTGDDYVEVDTRTPRSCGADSFWGWLFGGGNGSVSVTYWVQVPEDIHLTINTVNGKIEAREVSGRIELETTNGGVEVEDAAGSVTVETTNGRIEVSLQEVARDESMRFQTTNGSITAEFSEDFSATVSASTTNGRVKCDFPITVKGEVRRNRLRGTIGHDGGRVSLRTTNGSISIRRR